MYAKALSAALDAARAAGDLLLREFLRPGGPRGHGQHAPIDEEAEELIAARLRNAFPGWGFKGEETRGWDPEESEPHLWVVDPNDGTSSYLKGFRGSAVSIALLNGGRPVLGVVHAFAEDDLLAWAEGCGPVQRNGRPLPPPRWPSKLGPTDVVMLSQSADRASASNARAVAPARFRAVPGIARRLALAAAGEGVAGVSLNAPRDWDYAAGHALLRGVGGELVDQDGRLVTYPGSVRSCFGGGPAVVRQLAQRDWHAVMAGEPRRHEDYPLTRPSRDLLEPDAGRLSRARGCLYGQVAGDSLGGLHEFRSAAEIGEVRHLQDGGVWNLLAGQPTDDSELALLLARSLLQGTPQEAAYRWWYASNPFDCGATTARALRGTPNPDSQANGSLMRVSPLAVACHGLPPDAIAEAAREDSDLTHPNPVCRDACAAFCVAVAHAIHTGASPEETHEQALRWAADHAHPDVTRALRQARHQKPSSEQSGWVLLALQNAFHRLLHQDLEEGVVATVKRGGDTDTNAAIAGALLGAVHGERAVPQQWRSMILSCRPLPGTRRPRPRAFWPVDLPVLAEHLSCAGSPRRSAAPTR